MKTQFLGLTGGWGECAARTRKGPIMAAAMLAGMLGPQLQEYADTYDWQYSCCGMGCTGSADLVAAGKESIQWENVQGRYVPAAANTTAYRDPRNPNWFITDSGGVWVLTKTTDPLQFYASRWAATKATGSEESGAPTLTAMRRTGPSPAASKQAGPKIAGRYAAGKDGAPPAMRAVPTNQREQLRAEKEEARENARVAELAAVREAVEFKRQKDRLSELQRRDAMDA